MEDKYLIEDPEREREAVRLLAESPFLGHALLTELGLSPPNCWYLLQCLAPSLGIDGPGDVDLIVGRLPAHGGVVQWRPSVEYLVAAEAKCARQVWNQDDGKWQIKSAKRSPEQVAHTRSQVDNLLRDGFDRVILLDIISNMPVGGEGSLPWQQALALATQAREKMACDLKNRLPNDSPAGHWVWSVGAIDGGTEKVRGAGGPLKYRPSQVNPALQHHESQGIRATLEDRLQVILSALTPAPSPPYVFLDCRECKTIHWVGTPCGEKGR